MHIRMNWKKFADLLKNKKCPKKAPQTFLMQCVMAVYIQAKTKIPTE